MQTFVPFTTFEHSLECLDNKRLGKQRVEAYQIYKALTLGGGWSNHPATKMWAGYVPALCRYHNVAIKEWIERGYNNNMLYLPIEGEVIMPWWWGSEIHYTHRCNLMRKDPDWYSQYFEDVLDINTPYYWPTKVRQSAASTSTAVSS